MIYNDMNINTNNKTNKKHEIIIMTTITIIKTTLFI